VILLDTNVVSEALKPRPEPVVIAWIDAQRIEDLFLASVSLAELHTGIEIMPPGRRRDALAQLLQTSLERLFQSRIVPFDERAAIVYAAIFAKARALGISIAMGDGQIAAIAHVHGYSVATRDESPFRSAGIPVINPWRS
jgi:predicted nucleic acid-binding protein